MAKDLAGVLNELPDEAPAAGGVDLWDVIRESTPPEPDPQDQLDRAVALAEGRAADIQAGRADVAYASTPEQVEALARRGLEQEGRRRGGVWGAVPAAVRAPVENLAAGFSGRVAEYGASAPQAAAWLSGNEEIQAAVDDILDEAAARRQKAGQLYAGTEALGINAGDALQGIGGLPVDMAVMMGAGGAARPLAGLGKAGKAAAKYLPLVGAPGMSASTTAYKDARDEGLTGWDAAKYALAQGASEGLLTAAFGFNGLEAVADPAKRALVGKGIKALLKGVLGEVTEENVQNLSSLFIDYGMLPQNQGKPMSSLFRDWMAQMPTTTLVAAVGGAAGEGLQLARGEAAQDVPTEPPPAGGDAPEAGRNVAPSEEVRTEAVPAAPPRPLSPVVPEGGQEAKSQEASPRAAPQAVGQPPAAAGVELPRIPIDQTRIPQAKPVQLPPQEAPRPPRRRSGKGGDIIEEILAEGGIAPRPQDYQGGEYDDMPVLPPSWRVTQRSAGTRPDHMAQVLEAAGIGDGTTNTMWQLIRDAAKQRKVRDQDLKALRRPPAEEEAVWREEQARQPEMPSPWEEHQADPADPLDEFRVEHNEELVPFRRAQNDDRRRGMLEARIRTSYGGRLTATRTGAGEYHLRGSGGLETRAKLATEDEIRGAMAEGKLTRVPNGWYHPRENTLYLVPGMASATTMDHEGVHLMRSWGLIHRGEWRQLVRAAARAEVKGVPLARRVAAQYGAGNQEELVAAYIEGLADGSIKTEERGLGQRLLDWFRDLLDLVSLGQAGPSRSTATRRVRTGEVFDRSPRRRGRDTGRAPAESRRGEDVPGQQSLFGEDEAGPPPAPERQEAVTPDTAQQDLREQVAEPEAAEPAPSAARSSSSEEASKDPRRLIWEAVTGGGQNHDFSDWIHRQWGDFYREGYRGQESSQEDFDQWLEAKHGDGEYQVDPDVPGVSRDDIPWEAAYRAHTGTSHVPEERAAYKRWEYVQHMANRWETIRNRVAAMGLGEDVARDVFDEFKTGYLKRQLAALASRNGLMSSFIAGPAKFPAARMEKRSDAAHRKVTDLLDWEKRFMGSLERRLKPQQSPEQRADAEVVKLKQKAARALGMAARIEANPHEGWDRGAFSRSLSGMLERSLAAGQVAAVREALDWVEAQQAQKLKRPVITKRNKLYRMLEEAEAAQQVQEEAGVDPDAVATIAEFDGAEILREPADNRVRIYFEDKPDVAVRAALKAGGWRWSRRAEAWQRQATANAEASAKRIVGRFFEAAQDGEGPRFSLPPPIEERPYEPKRMPTVEEVAEDARRTFDRPWEEVVAEYEAHPESDGGREVNADVFRDLVPAYNQSFATVAEFAGATHEAVKVATERYWQHMLARQDLPGRSAVMFLAGGAASGKGSATRYAGLGQRRKSAQIVLDGTLSNAKKAIKKVQEVLATGRRAEIVFIQRNAVAAAEGMLKRAQDDGKARTVPLEVMLGDHVKAQHTILALQERFKDDPRVEVHFINNDLAEGQAKEEDRRLLERSLYSRMMTEEGVRDATHRLLAQALGRVEARITDEHVRRGSGLEEARRLLRGRGRPGDGRDSGRALRGDEGDLPRRPGGPSREGSGEGEGRGLTGDGPAFSLPDGVSLDEAPADLSDIWQGYEETAKRWREAHGVTPQDWAQRLRARLRSARSGIGGAGREHFVHLRRHSDARAIQIFRTFDESLQSAPAIAERMIMDVVRPLQTKREMRLFELETILPDLMRDIEEGLYEDRELPFELPHGAAAAVLLERARKAATPAVKVAVRKRRQLMEGLAKQLVRQGLLAPEILDDPRYYHHIVLAYATGGRFGSGRRVRHIKRGWQRERFGSDDWNTAYAEAEMEFVTEALEELARANTLAQLREEFDVSAEAIHEADVRNEDAYLEKINEGRTAADVRKEINTLTERYYEFEQRWGRHEKQTAEEVAVVRKVEDRLEQLDPRWGTFAENDLHLMVMADALVGQTGSQRVPFDIQGMLQELPTGRTGLDEAHPDFPALLRWISAHTHLPQDLRVATENYLRAIATRMKIMRKEVGPRWVTWRQVAREMGDAYQVWQPKEGNELAPAWTASEMMVQRALVAAGVKSDLEAGELRDLMPDVLPLPSGGLRRGMVVVGPKQQWLLPSQVAKHLESRKLQEAPTAGRYVEAALSEWKQFILLNPLRIVKYSLNNLVGDTDVAMTHPGMLPHVPGAARDIWRYLTGKELPPGLEAELRRAAELGVMDAGMSAEELPDVQDATWYRALAAKDPNKVVDFMSEVGKSLVGKGKTFAAFQRWREGILRLAAYRRFRAQLVKDPTKRRYGASSVKEMNQHYDRLDAAEGKERREQIEMIAAQLSRELLGDYGNLSMTGEWLRRHLIPFWSWCEINFPRYVRLIRNARYEGGSGTKTALALLPGRAVSLGMLMGLTSGMVYAWNHAIKRALGIDDEDDPNEGIDKQYIIVGKTVDGRVISIKTNGALADALGWLDLGDPLDKAEMIAKAYERDETGKAVRQVLTDMALAPVRQSAEGLTPMIKTPMEAITGQSFFPDVFQPRTTRYRGDAIAGAFGYQKVVKVADDRGAWYDPLLGAVFSVQDPEARSYWDFKRLVWDWNEEHGKGGGNWQPNDRTNALYEARSAFLRGHKDRAKRWMERYLELGGTPGRVKSSMRNMHPLHWMPKKQREPFMQQLTPKERRLYERALKYWEETVNDDDGLKKLAVEVARGRKS